MKNRTLLIGLSAGATIGLVLSIGLALYKNSLTGKYPPGTFVSGINLSYKTPLEAKKELNDLAQKYLTTPLKINILGKVKELSPQALGLDISTNDTLKTLKTIDLNKTFLVDLLGLGVDQNENINPVVSLDYDRLFVSLDKSFDLETLKAKSATFGFDKMGELTINEGQDGVAINEDSLILDLKNSAKEFSNKEISVKTHNEKSPITKAELTAQQDKIIESLNQTIKIVDPVYKDDWLINLRKHLDWIQFAPKEQLALPIVGGSVILDTISASSSKQNPLGNNFIAIEIDEKKLNEFVDQNISKWLDKPSEDVNISTDKDGKVVIVGKGSNGKKIQRHLLKQAIEMAIANKIPSVPVPTVEITPKMTISPDLQAKGITERLAVGHTSYYGSHEGRVQNVKVGASKFNGVLIAPDEIFNFNKTLGIVDDTTGYVKELVIKPEGTVPDFGGGICQVSTTMYRTALFAGLPIVERNQHTYAVSYYSQILGDGLDATIFLGGPNLKFKNDTGHSILIQSYTDGDYELYFVFYGTSDGRHVKMEGPQLSNHVNPGPTEITPTTALKPGETKKMDNSHVGFDALWYRHLFDKTGKETVEPIYTHYKAIPEKILVGVAALPVPVVTPAPGTPKTPAKK